jgi:putative acetyltransferase
MSLNPKPSIVLERTAHATDEARDLIAALEGELSAVFEPHQQHGLSIEKLFQPHIHFYVARLDGRAMGCGGVAFDEGYAELKRMYVRPEARGLGVAQAVLAQLERDAREKGYRRLTLETGDTLGPAQRLYESAGFVRCAAFGHYRELPPETIERSFFFEKALR